MNRSPSPRLLLLPLGGLLVFSGAAWELRNQLQKKAGLHADYVVESYWVTDPALTVDPAPSTASIARAWYGTPPPHFRTHWSGFLTVPRTQAYTFATTSDDGSVVLIDGRTVVDNSGNHARQLRTGDVSLEAGPHEIRIDYEQAGGSYFFEFMWARPGASLTQVPRWLLWRRPTSYWQARAAQLVDPLPFIGVIASALLGATLLWGQARERVAAYRKSISLRRLSLRLVLLTASCAVAVTVAEVAAQAAFRNVRSSGDARNYFANAAIRPRVNNLGYRDPDVAISDASRYRIVVIGDSITWGQGLDEEHRFTNLLQQSLGPAYEVLNFGIPGRNLVDHIVSLERVRSVVPDFVLLQLYTNDFELPGMQRPHVRSLLPIASLDAALLRSSVLYTLLNSQWQQLQVNAGLTESYEHYLERHLRHPDAPVARKAFGLVAEFFARARELQLPAGAVMFPNPEILEHGTYSLDFIHVRVLEICRAEQVSCVDLRRPFTSRFRDLHEIVVSPFDGHPSAAANRVAAEEILGTFGAAWRQGAAEASHAARRR